MHSVACSGSSIKNLLVVSIKISLYTPRMSLSFIGFSIISRYFSIRFSRYDLSLFSSENDDSILTLVSCVNRSFAATGLKWTRTTDLTLIRRAL